MTMFYYRMPTLGTGFGVLTFSPVRSASRTLTFSIAD